MTCHFNINEIEINIKCTNVNVKKFKLKMFTGFVLNGIKYI